MGNSRSTAGCMLTWLRSPTPEPARRYRPPGLAAASPSSASTAQACWARQRSRSSAAPARAASARLGDRLGAGPVPVRAAEARQQLVHLAGARPGMPVRIGGDERHACPHRQDDAVQPGHHHEVVAPQHSGQSVSLRPRNPADRHLAELGREGRRDGLVVIILSTAISSTVPIRCSSASSSRQPCGELAFRRHLLLGKLLLGDLRDIKARGVVESAAAHVAHDQPVHTGPETWPAAPFQATASPMQVCSPAPAAGARPEPVVTRIGTRSGTCALASWRRRPPRGPGR